MKFTKYHGLGNDFLIVDRPPGARSPSTADVIRVCDRRRGVGADGVLICERSEVGGPARMVIYNADGTRPEMCGNGLRCFVRWLVEMGLEQPGEIAVETDAGLRVSHLAVRPRGSGEAGAVQVLVDMGRARFDRSEVPMVPGPGPGETSIEVIEIDGVSLRVRGVSMGNPHAVVRVPESSTLAAAQRFGVALSTHAVFPEQCNAGFLWFDEAHQHPPRVSLTVWERGCGITQACGTGACAAVAALSQDHPELLDQEVLVELPGGELVISVPSDPDSGILMRGPAVRLFEVESWWNAV